MFEKSKWLCRILETEPEVYCENPAPYFIRDFEVHSTLRRATLNIVALGEGAFYLDGKRIPDSFRPTHPMIVEKAIVYTTYDLTELLASGEHRLGVLAGNQRWRLPDSRYRYALPCIIVQLELEYADGSREVIVSDESFLCADSPIVFNATRSGEKRDLRLEIPDWCCPGCALEAFRPADIYTDPNGYLAGEFRPTDAPPIRKMSEYSGIEVSPGLYDFTITTAGHARVKLRAKPGEFIKIAYGERLTEDGHAEIRAYTAGRYPDMYNCDGFFAGGELGADGLCECSFETELSFHAARYVELYGEYTDATVTLIAAYTDIPLTSRFECDNDILNKLHAACVNSMLTCWQGMPLDNPKRDAPWAGDVMLDAENYAQNFDFYDTVYEYVLELIDSQYESGYLPTMAPCCFSWVGSRARFIGPDWGDSGMISLVYYTCKITGRRELAELAFDSMERTMGYFETLTEGGLIVGGLGTGDWSGVKEDGTTSETVNADVDIMSNCYYYLDALQMAQLAEFIGRDAEKYRVLAENIRAAFRKKHVGENGYMPTKIAEKILPAALGLLDEGEREKAVAEIVAEIERDGLAITFGVHGIRFFHKLLTDHGYGELVLKVLTNKDVPGYARCLYEGMTTVPERFDWYKTPLFSLNHHFFAVIDTWLFESLAGIRADGFGFEGLTIEPRFIPEIGCVKAEMQGICVEYDEKLLKIRSPYTFKLILSGAEQLLDAGEYTFER